MLTCTSSSYLLQPLYVRATTWQSGSRWSFLEKFFWIEPTSMWWLNILRTKITSRWWWIYSEIRAGTFNLRRSMCLKWVSSFFFLRSENMPYSNLPSAPPFVSRCSWPIPKSHHKLRSFYKEIRKSCWIFWKIFTTTKTRRVRILILSYISSPIVHTFFSSFFKRASTHNLLPVDEQFSDEKQFLIVQIQNL